ncbi:hypothetical protein [Escherichia coli]|uniref:hypothetical protein n=1 Tax=Escherichia coli TaxID=562 RepID=UPI0007750212|nr:hypothetical protein [Escherichia coli]KXQ82768.1 hypothetical protein AUQ18_09010 [Escherichia coli]KXR85729.1 hypothetical protein AUQ29_06690 [Escherichia coli]OAC14815.1 hypothetical protein EC13107_36c00420 [Escherichia coli]OAC28545.1 hypothetical protein EC3234A_230c01110 [Escherichia coli]SQM27092.1 Uncharacterised protein [Escherichia coli]
MKVSLPVKTLLVGLFVTSIMLPAGFYFYINKADVSTFKFDNAKTSSGIIYHIDRCRVEDGRLVVNGWAAVKNYNLQTLYSVNIYAGIGGDKWLRIPKSMTRRSDVSRAFGKPLLYDRSGFNSQVRNKKVKKFTGNIAILINDGLHNYEIHYQCK